MKSPSEVALACRSCGEERPIEEYRIFRDALQMDFCVWCERAHGTITLYRRWSSYATPAVSAAVFAAERTPDGRRTPEQVRLLIQPQRKEAPETRQEMVQQELQRRELCRRSLIYYTSSFDGTYKAGWVHHDIARRLERFMRAIERGESPRLAVFMPPRHGKSRIASDMFPSWVLGHHPEWPIIAASYGLDLPVGFSRLIRDRLKDPEYKAMFDDTNLRADTQGVENWMTTRGGGYLAAGVGVGITGKGFMLGIVDDPIKDFEASQSETIRDSTWGWYQSTFRTRAAPGAGILLIQCMVGATRVLMADGTEKLLRDVRAGDVVASYMDGHVVPACVANWANQGSDCVFAIKTSSGKTARANGRHPFLVARNGEQVWVKLRNLRVGDVLIGVDANGRENPALQMGVKSPQLVADFAALTTTNTDGRAEPGRHQSMQNQDALRTSDIDTTFPSLNTTPSSQRNEVGALSAMSSPEKTYGLTGEENCVSTTTTQPAKFEACCATTATSLSATGEPKRYFWPLLDTCEITWDEIVEIVADGYEDVFDVQVEGTENFIADGLVSHNTRWHDLDPAGRLLEAEKQLRLSGIPEEQIEQWEVVSYPAIAEHDEFLLGDGSIWTGTPPQDVEVRRLLRNKGDALHPERYSINDLHKLKNAMSKGIWAALYQQNPTPDDGDFFRKSYFRYAVMDPERVANMTKFITVDYAIGKRQRNDWTVMGVHVHMPNGELVTLEIRRGRWGTKEIVRNAVELIVKWKADIYAGEQGQIHYAVFPLIQEALDERKVYITVDDSLKPIQDKEARARPLQARMQNGKHVFSYALENRDDIVDQVERELLRFPNGSNDDIVDMLAWAARLALTITSTAEEPPPPLPSWIDELEAMVAGGSGTCMAA